MYIYILYYIILYYIILYYIYPIFRGPARWCSCASPGASHPLVFQPGLAKAIHMEQKGTAWQAELHHNSIIYEAKEKCRDPPPIVLLRLSRFQTWKAWCVQAARTFAHLMFGPLDHRRIIMHANQPYKYKSKTNPSSCMLHTINPLVDITDKIKT